MTKALFFPLFFLHITTTTYLFSIITQPGCNLGGKVLWIRNQVDAGGLMEKNGGAQKTLRLATNILTATCTAGNRSRKRLESPTHKPTAKPNAALAISSSATSDNGNGSGGLFKSNTMSPIAAEPLTFIGGGSTGFPLSGPSHSFDLLHFNQRSAESITETKGLLRSHKDLSEVDRSDSQTLRHFFDDWPRAIQEPRNTKSNGSLRTSLSISVPGIHPNSDVSLKRSTGVRDEPESGFGEGNGERERSQLHRRTTWGGNQMGGPLAEALR